MHRHEAQLSLRSGTCSRSRKTGSEVTHVPESLAWPRRIGAGQRKAHTRSRSGLDTRGLDEADRLQRGEESCRLVRSAPPWVLQELLAPGPTPAPSPVQPSGDATRCLANSGRPPPQERPPALLEVSPTLLPHPQAPSLAATEQPWLVGVGSAGTTPSCSL